VSASSLKGIKFSEDVHSTLYLVVMFSTFKGRSSVLRAGCDLRIRDVIQLFWL